MRSLGENADDVTAWTDRQGQLPVDEFWLAEVVNCAVGADLGPLAVPTWAFRYELTILMRWCVRAEAEPGLSQPEQRERMIT
jgi:hypothetical protein